MAGRSQLALFAFVAALLVLLGGGHLYSPDAVIMFRMSEALLQGQLAFDPHGQIGLGGTEAGDGLLYTKYGLGMSLAGLPLVALGQLLDGVSAAAEQGVFHTPATALGPENWSGPPAGWKDDRAFRWIWYGTGPASFGTALSAWLFSWVSAFATAGCAVVVARLVELLGMARRTALLTALAVVLLSPMLHYGREGWSEPLATLFTLGILERVLVHRRTGATGALVVAGALGGGLVLTKVALVLLALPLCWMLLDGKRAWGRLLPVALGAAPMLALMGAYNAARFGSPIATGYGEELALWTTPWQVGLSGLWVGPSRGLFWFAPLLWTAAVGWSALDREGRRLLGAGLAGLVLLSVFYCRWWAWEGGWCWGPRFLLPALPWVLLAVAPVLDGRVVGWRRGVGALGLLAGGVTSWLSIRVNPHDYYQWLKAWALDNPTHWSAGDWSDLALYDWQFSPLLTWWRFPVTETNLAAHVVGHHGVVEGTLALALVVALVAAVWLSRALRAGAP